jgi:hypothetical protein
MNRLTTASVMALGAVLLAASPGPAEAEVSFSVTPAADVHTGAAPGDAAGYIAPNGTLDISGMATGDVLVFDVTINDLDYPLRALSLEVTFPEYVVGLSEDEQDWIDGTGAVVTPGELLHTFPAEILTNFPQPVGNLTGQVDFAAVFTDALCIPGFSGTLPATQLLRVAFTLRPSAAPTCRSLLEQISVATNPRLLADDANVHGSGLATDPTPFSDDVAFLRADANRNADRGDDDALTLVRCVLYGKDDVDCGWSGQSSGDFDQTFDINCDGVVSPVDATAGTNLAVGMTGAEGAGSDHFTNDPYDLANQAETFIQPADPDNPACDLSAFVLSKAEQKCIAAINKAAAGVAGAAAKLEQSCVKLDAAGKLTGNASECVGTDAKSVIAKAQTKTGDAFDKSCASGSGFMALSVATANAAAVDEMAGLRADFFGGSLGVAVLSDKAEAKCQQGLEKATNALALTQLKAFSTCKKKALKTAVDILSIEACLDTVGSAKKVAKSAAKIADAHTKFCEGISEANVAPGACSAAMGDAFDDCLVAAARCRACRMLSAIDGIAPDCDVYDNATVDASCAPLD